MEQVSRLKINVHNYEKAIESQKKLLEEAKIRTIIGN